ncbi:proline-rich protein PRCC [Lethenteron reissneri]|uniref:proline-rich protein PRCC n=1 Tax=Lethenteron reissneri TaxID=7753 RepID=UPI002AB60B8E|nr:proline-rich protein PRCC [Lethenteron reissneri]
MSLVAYASSDEDDEEKAAAAASTPGLLAPRRRGQPVRIAAPALRAPDSDDEDEEPKVKRFVPSTVSPGATGLSALLPKPRGGVLSASSLAGTKVTSRPLVPHALTKARRAAAPTAAQVPSPSAIKAASRAALLQRVARQALPHALDDDASDGEEEQAASGGGASFFSLPARPGTGASPSGVAVKLLGAGTAVPCPATGDSVQDAPLEFSGMKADAGEPGEFPGDYGGGGYQGYYEQPYGAEMATAGTEPGTSIVDNDAFRRLQGKRNRGEEINFIEIKGEEQMSGAKEWLTKSLTQEKTMKSFSKKKGDQPSTQQKRKHQITYLMHQAKERELELKNSWSENKLTRRQTQAKYGF